MKKSGADSVKSSAAGTILELIIILFIAYLAYAYRAQLVQFIGSTVSGLQSTPIGNFTRYAANSTVRPQQNLTQLYAYALQLINSDRHKYGLGNVTLSNETSAQQHADSMLLNHYFSHWDIYGMKPYMRYTLLGGTGAVSENIAYQYNVSCSVVYCEGNIDPETAIENSEYSMMYNDSVCCNDGHRDNILDPNHNQVSIGVAYNGSTIYFVEDFINNYINWNNDTPAFSKSNYGVYLSGSIQDNYSFNKTTIAFDPPVQNMSIAELHNTSSYGYGDQIAGVANYGYYYTSVQTITADKYSVGKNNFQLAFSLQKQVQQYGAGEYTVFVWLNNKNDSGSFIGATYTIFVNGSLGIYEPANV